MTIYRGRLFGPNAEEAAQREITNLQKQIALQATLVDGQERITTLARTHVEIELGQYKLASAAAQEELHTYSAP